MNPVQESMAKHAALYAFLLSLLPLVLLSALTLAIIISNEINKAIETSEAAALAGKEIVTEAVETLREAERTIPANCEEETLAALRRLQFRTKNIGDIGVLTDNTELLCSSFLGVLDAPFPKPELDTIIKHDGEDFGYLYQFPVLIGSNLMDATLIYLGNFNVVIKPQSYADMIKGDIGLLRSLSNTGKTSTVFENKAVSNHSRQLLFSNRFSPEDTAQTNTLFFEPLHLSLVLRHMPVGDNQYYYLTEIHLLGKLYQHRQTLTLLLLLYCFVAFLVFRLLKDKFTRWTDISFRIKNLLTPEFIRCYYQPVVDLANNRIVGCEVLMRIEDNDQLLFPDSFFPEVINQSLQTKLDTAVTETLVKDLSQQQLPDSIEKIGVNFFPETISRGLAYPILKNLINTLGDHLVINLEILEQDFHGSLVDEINRIRSLGVTISIDDFGTGYSNLGSIRSISPDFLKIDRSFIDGMDKSSIRSSLIPEIINIARVVEAEVVAEGIEEAEQIPILRNLGVEYLQGYYIARPMPFGPFCDFVKNYD